MLEGFMDRPLRHRRRIRGAITGGLASGKSTSLKAFQKQGWLVLSSDQIVSDLYERKGLTKAQVLKKFGTTKAGLKKLEAWIHPLVKREIQRVMKATSMPTMVEVPLLFESGFEKLFDFSVYVHSADRDRKARALRRGMTPSVFKALNARQWPARDKAQAADFILVNTTKADLKKQVKALSNFLKLLTR